MEVGSVAETANAGGGFASALFSIFGFIFLTLFILLAVIVLAVIIKKILSRFLFSAQISNNLSHDKFSFLHIKVSHVNEQKEDAMEELLTSLHHLLPNNTHLSLEMASSNQFLNFFIVVPKEYKSVFESQLYAQFPDTEIEEIQEYLPSTDQNLVVEDVHFKHSSANPILTYHNIEEDLLKNLSALFAKAEGDEKVFFQLSLKRVGSRIWQREFKNWPIQLFGTRYNGDNPTPAFAKLSQDLYIGKLRVAYQAKDKVSARVKLNTIMGLFKSFKSSVNELKKKRFVLTRSSFSAMKARIFNNGDFWTPAEIATIYHFPFKGSIVSNVVDTTSKRAPAPDILPFLGQVEPNQVSFFGQTNYRSEAKVFGIKRIDRRRHMYVIGKTGSGKSRLLQLLLISDIVNGQGCCLLDPHGDLAEELLKYVPKDRIKDVVYIDPADRNFPIGFNPLEPVQDYEARQHLSRFFIAIFKKLFAGTWNARMEHLIRYITLALLETPDSNVLGIPRMLADTSFRQRVIKQIQDPVVKSFWTNEFSSSNEQFLNDAAVPILNKVGQFISNPIVRNMVGQRKNVLKFDEFMNSGKIVLVNLSKGKLGDDNAALLGSMIITKIQQAALERAKIPEEERRDFYFYIDEFQNFATDAFSSILSEARKYHLDLTIAHQYMDQLPEDVRATTFGNVGSIVVFAVGGGDASYLAKEFAPTFTPDDMINLNTREMYVKMSVDGKLTIPFSARTIDTPQPTTDYSIEIINNSRLTYSKNKVAVENEIEQWSRSSEATNSSGDTDDSFPEPII